MPDTSGFESKRLQRMAYRGAQCEIKIAKIQAQLANSDLVKGSKEFKVLIKRLAGFEEELVRRKEWLAKEGKSKELASERSKIDVREAEYTARQQAGIALDTERNRIDDEVAAFRKALEDEAISKAS